ncbi:hypothetical protein [Staphylococcus epidermidis]|nr:hypothetical protein [Staphylococcus epidermidis]
MIDFVLSVIGLGILIGGIIKILIGILILVRKKGVKEKECKKVKN